MILIATEASGARAPSPVPVYLSLQSTPSKHCGTGEGARAPDASVAMTTVAANVGRHSARAGRKS
jgi:hypothetical protein